MTYVLPPVPRLNSLSDTKKKELLDNLFESHPTIINYLLFQLFTEQFSSYKSLIEKVRTYLYKLDPHDKATHEIISSHPRLGIPRTDLSEHSSKEQISLQGDDELVTIFTDLNKRYEATYPGLRFVLFVNGREKDEVVKLFENRIQRNDFNAEVKEALDAICDIALDRATKLSE